MTAANGLEQRSGRRVRRGPRQLPKVAQDPACGPPWRNRVPRPPPWAAGRLSRGRGGHSHAGRSRGRASRPWPPTHAVAPSRSVDSSSSGVAHVAPTQSQAASAAAPGLGSVPRGANRLPSRHRATAATPLVGSCRGRRPSHPCTRADPGGSADVGAPPGGVRRPPSAERQSASGHPGWLVVHVVPLDPMPGRGLDLATDQLVLPESRDQLVPVPRRKHRRHF